MLNVSAVDTNIFEKNGRWWLITNICSGDLKDHSSELHIFSSDNPISTEWKPNKQNPVIFDPLIGRNGGLIIDNEEVYRVRQKQGFNLYGEALEVAKIIKLSDEEYKEEKIFKVEPKFFSGINGTHTYNYKNGLLTIDYLK